MSLSLVGIIAIQAYYINDSVDNENERFKFNVVKALNYVSNTIEENESEMYFSKFLNLDSEKKTDEDAVSQLLIYQKNNSTKEPATANDDISTPNNPSIASPTNKNPTNITKATRVACSALISPLLFFRSIIIGIEPKISITAK